ncbi:Nitrogen regulation protein, NtrB signal transduction histidine kinase [Oceaniovalibus guishaninsula JLT2003]|uniref:histidine kinase n=1 Tax=Oceaniovalibus guishaninsula JLT2003 TaxID=1231392 RepID=K2H7I9_9RHOB|nr:ATP-binding protein [Oceaniovalibus guishaninsula]EKE43583.1 Nitrogen regulation protein, NtrB signal transduction histidine kinase [Oceaniovalibus guishaninsula JLT2003]
MTGDADTLWSALPVPCLLIDAADRVADINPAAEAFLNASARTLRGRPLEGALRADTALDGACDRLRRRGVPVFVGSVALDVAGGAQVCNLHLAPMAGEVLLLVHPRPEGERLARGGTARSSARAAIGMAEMLAHEIKNPLAGITGAAQLLSMDLDAQGRALTDLIVAESRRVVALLDQVEQFGNLTLPECRAVNIHDLLDRARRSAVVGFAAHMRLIDRYDPSLPPAWVDPDRMMQVLLNLIRNAAEAAGPQGGTVTLRTAWDGALRLRRADGTDAALPIRVEIADDGPGLPPDLIDTAFDPFVSGRENGTGLGLALVDRIVSDHGGLVSVQSRPGCTAFRLSLPQAAAFSSED